MPTGGSVAIMDEGRYAGRLAVASQRHLRNNIFKGLTGLALCKYQEDPILE
jgi:hypothetical protein